MFKQLLIYLLAFLAFALPCHAGEKEVPQWVVVTPPAFREAMEPLIEHRKAENLKVVVVQTTDVLSAEQIRQGEAKPLKEHLHKLCNNYDGPTYILLAGAVKASDPTEAEKTVVPPLRGTISRMKGQPSDHDYGCADGNFLPSAAVGRFPALTPD
jgi:hypothetical protein